MALIDILVGVTLVDTETSVKEKQMFRGATILAIGFFLGYTKAVAEDEEIRKRLDQILAAIQQAANTPTPDQDKAPSQEPVIDVEPVDENTDPNRVDNSDAT